MSDFVTLNTSTSITTDSTSASILTFFINENLGDILSVSISSSVGTQDGVDFIENELLILMVDGSFPSSTNIEINSNGELEITFDDAANYSINTNGELEYTS